MTSSSAATNGHSDGMARSTATTAARISTEAFISARAKRWKPSAIRELYPLEKRPGMVSLLAGKPNADTFPFESITMKLKGSKGSKGESLTIEGGDLDEALQYAGTAGLPRLVQWLEAFQSEVHRRGSGADEGWRVTVGVGSQDLISKAFRALTDDGDSVLLETPVYSGVLGTLAPEQLNLVEVDSDDTGLSSDALAALLASWQQDRPNQRFPRILYACPTGSNPTGRSATESTKRAILRLCKQHDLLIMEDAAYDYLYYGDQPRAPSFFELEAQELGETGRVVRFDSMSKLVSSGMRIGFMTAAKPICDAVDLMSSNTNLQASSTSQAILLKLLQHWGPQGFLDHCQHVSAFYRAKRDMFETAAHKHLDGLADWVTPVAGMFLFLRLHGTTDSFALIRNKAVEKGVLALPGTVFMPSGSETAFVRVSFSLASEQDAELAFSRLREVLLEMRK